MEEATTIAAAPITSITGTAASNTTAAIRISPIATFLLGLLILLFLLLL